MVNEHMDWKRILMGIIGAGVLAGGTYLAYRQYDFLQSAVTAKGRVLEMVSRSRSKGKTSYAPKVSFKTAEGKTVEFTSKLSSSPPSYGVGETVDVLYDPAEPQSAEVKGFLSLWLGPIVLSIMGSFMFFFSLFGGRFYRKKNSVASQSMADNRQQ